MSNHEDETPDNFGMVFMNMPPEVREIIEHHRMHAEQAAHDTTNFFDSMTEDQLRSLRGVLGVIRSDPDSTPYFMGLVSSALQYKFGVCLGCGKKHDEELTKMAHPDVPSETRISDASKSKMTTTEYLNKCIEYRVHIRGDGPEVICNNCGVTYVSLEDRMLRRPDIEGCDGCIQKEKWG